MDGANSHGGINQKLGIGEALFLGFQSVLACNFFLGPIVIAGILKLDVASTAALIAMTFLACGIATIIQAGYFLKYPVVQGMSFAAIGAFVAIAMKTDFATAFGSMIPGAIVVIIVGYFKIFGKIVRRFIPPLVAGTVIIVVGVAIMPIVWNSLLATPGNQGINFLEAGISFAVLLVLMVLGWKPTPYAKLLRVGSVIYAMIIGTVISAFLGSVDFSPVIQAPWFAVPKIFPFGAPKIDISASLIMIFIYFVVMVESIGTWFTVSVITGEEMKDETINKGVIGEGLGCFIGTLVGGVPVTSYGTNSGVIALTKVFSRWSAVGAGAILVVLALCPKLMNMIAIVPGSVIWGVFGLMTVIIIMSGFQSIQKIPLNDRNSLIVGIPILITIGVSLLPAALIGQLPSLVSYLLGSAISAGALSAIIINLLIPEKKVIS